MSQRHFDDADIACVVCRARGIDAFEPSDAGFYVCVRCGTQSQTQVLDAHELGFDSDDGADGIIPGQGVGARGMRHRRSVGPRVRAVRARPATAHERRAARAAGEASEAYVRAFQGILRAQTTVLMGVLRGMSEEDGGFEESVREIWGRYAVACGALERRGPMDTDTDTATDAEDETDRGGRRGKKRASTARRMTKRMPLVMTLGLLYLVCARRRNAILPLDLAKMAEDGSLPYINLRGIINDACGEAVFDALPFDEIFKVDIGRKHMPSPEKISAAALYAAAKIGVQMPPINAAALLTRFVGALSLGDEVLGAAQRTLALYLSPRLRYDADKVAVGSPESTLFAYIVVALKFLYGLDGRTRTKSQEGRRAISKPKAPAVSPTGWAAWADAVAALGAPSRYWTIEELLSLDREGKDEFLRFFYHEQLADSELPFPFDRIEAKLLKLVPHSRLNAAKATTKQVPAPVPTTADPYLKYWRTKHALAEIYERRVRFNAAIAVYDARVAAEELNTAYNPFNVLHKELEKKVLDRVGGIGIRRKVFTSERDLIMRTIGNFMRGSKDEMMEVIGGVKSVSFVRLEALVRRIIAASIVKTRSVEISEATLLRGLRSCVNAVVREDAQLASQFPGSTSREPRQELVAAVKRALVELAHEQALSTDISPFENNSVSYDISSSELSAAYTSLVCTRMVAMYLPASSAPFTSAPQEYAQVVEALAQYAWIDPELLHESVQELEYMLFQLESFIDEEVNPRAAKKVKTAPSVV